MRRRYSHPDSLLRFVLASVLIWTQLGFLWELREIRELYRQDTLSYADARAWRFGTGPVENLARFLEQARRTIPEEAIVLFSSLRTPDRQELRRFLWAAYFLPRHHLVQAPLPRPAEPRANEGVEGRPRYWIAYRSTVDRGGLEPILTLPDGVVYRIEP